MAMIDFDREKYMVIDELITGDMAKVFSNYFILKRNVAAKLFDAQYIPPEEMIHGTFNDPQCPGMYSLYGDPLFDSHMLMVQPKIEQVIGKKLVEMYTFGRVYTNGATLDRHTDRKSCEISLTMNLGGDPWPIFADGEQVDLNPGDCLVYKGCEVEHWREKFEGEVCTQVFYHYNPIENSETKADNRPLLGLPPAFKKQ
jgi:hypothetical protein